MLIEPHYRVLIYIGCSSPVAGGFWFGRLAGTPKAFPFGEGGPRSGSGEIPLLPPRAYAENDVVQAARTSSVFDETTQAFFIKSTFPKGEGYFGGPLQLPDKSDFL